MVKVPQHFLIFALIFLLVSIFFGNSTTTRLGIFLEQREDSSCDFCEQSHYCTVMGGVTWETQLKGKRWPCSKGFPNRPEIALPSWITQVVLVSFVVFDVVGFCFIFAESVLPSEIVSFDWLGLVVLMTNWPLEPLETSWDKPVALYVLVVNVACSFGGGCHHDPALPGLSRDLSLLVRRDAHCNSCGQVPPWFVPSEKEIYLQKPSRRVQESTRTFQIGLNNWDPREFFTACKLKPSSVVWC